MLTINSRIALLQAEDEKRIEASDNVIWQEIEVAVKSQTQ